MAYQVRLDVFDGPLDLLLFFIKRDEIDIYDIPISQITKSYLSYLDLMRQMNISVAGEYIRIAATLMRIKARMLLPQPVAEDDEDYEDPRSELVQMLLEYKQFKETSEHLQVMEAEQRQHFPRKTDLSYIDTDVHPDEVLSDVTLYDIMQTFRRLLSEIPEPVTHDIKRFNTNIKKQTEYLLQRLHSNGRLRFSEIMKDLKEKIPIIVTFIALLDLMKRREVTVTQSDTFDDLHITPRLETAQV